jgi:hypothetical protein
MKHIPPVKSDLVIGVPRSADRACPPIPPAKIPNPMMMALAIKRMMRLVMLRVSTSEVEEALARNSRAVETRGEAAMVSDIFYVLGKKKKIEKMNNFFHNTFEVE